MTPDSLTETPERARSSAWLRFQKRLVIAVPTLWLALFFALPFLFIFAISLSVAQISLPPYAPILKWVSDTALSIEVDFGNYLFLLDDDLYVAAYLNSLRIAAIATLLCLFLAFPIALFISRQPRENRIFWLALVTLPFWTSFLLRVYAWIAILQSNGLLNEMLLWAGIIDQPLVLLHTDFAVYLGLVYVYLPFMVLPLYATLDRLDPSLIEASADLGAKPALAFFTVIVPLAFPGVMAGCLLVFVPAVGDFIIPALLGGPDTLMIGRVLWDEFFANRDWPMASAVAVVMLLLLVIPIMILRRGKPATGHA